MHLIGGSSFEFDAIGVEQAGQAAEREFRFPQAVRFGRDREVEGGAKIGLFEVRVKEDRQSEVAVGETRTGEVRAGKIGFLQIAAGEACVLEVEAAEERELHHAALKAHFEQQLSALAELHAEQLAAGERHLLKRRADKLHHAHVALLKGALPEYEARKIGLREGALHKAARLEHADAPVEIDGSDLFEHFAGYRLNGFFLHDAPRCARLLPLHYLIHHVHELGKGERLPDKVHAF